MIESPDSGAEATSRFTCPRRQVLLGAGVGSAALVLAGCGSSSGGSTTSGSSPAGSAGGGTNGGTPSGITKGLIAVSDVPSNKAVSVKDDQGRTLLLSQSGGKVTALDATCTHQGCTVQPEGSALMCPCHGSAFTLTGQVTQGPAPTALESVPVTVSAGQVVLA